LVRTKRIDVVVEATRNVVADAIVNSEEIARLSPLAANAEVDVANEVTLGEESHQRTNLVGDAATGNEVGKYSRETYIVALCNLHGGCVDRGSEDSTGDGEELSGEHSCKDRG
jgi:hypothetical protein